MQYKDTSLKASFPRQPG